MNEKVVIITGGTGALGRFIVEKYAKEGWKVYIPVASLQKFMKVFDNSQDDKSNFSLRRIYAFECDALNEDSVVEFVQKVSALEKGRIDTLVNTVGGFHQAIGVSDFSTEEFDIWFNLNFKTTFWFSREVLKVMQKVNSGRIVCISSIAGLSPLPERLAYNISKTAIINLMENIKKENHGIKCNAIIPSVIDTPANREWGTEEEIKNWVRPEDIANLIYNLKPEDDTVKIKIGN